MTMWEFRWFQDGYKKANHSEEEKEAKPPTREQYEAALERFGVK